MSDNGALLIFYTSPATPLIESCELLLTLQPSNPDNLYNVKYPVAWKVVTFSPSEYNDTQILAVPYTGQLGFGVSQVDRDVIRSSVGTHIGPGQTVEYGTNGWGSPSPTPAPGQGPIIAVNDVERLENISIGVYGASGDFEPLILEPAVPFQGIIDGVFRPQLCAYSVHGVKENQIFWTDIPNKAGSWDLGSPPFRSTFYFLVYNDPASMKLLIKQTRTGPTSK